MYRDRKGKEMPTDHQMEGEDAVENDIETDGQRAVEKQSSNDVIKSSTDSTETEIDLTLADKSTKVTYQRSSNRITKRRKDQSSETVLKKAAAAHSVKVDTPSIRSKTRRPWELWSVEDKNAFFEALCEYGKDFENIQSYIAQRSKKKGVAVNMIKNKDQVRHFYYRTWHKISKFLVISESVQKQTQELYGLINYAELRKKIGGCLNEKNRLKLNELVFSGVTIVKHKGKKVRIKTPVCRALKKLNNFADAKEPESEKLPKEIVLELRPSTNAAWLHVQNMAQNPRIRTKVCLQKRLKPIIEYLQNRWKPFRLKRKEQILKSLPNYNSEELTCDIPPKLRVKPPRDVKIYPLTLSVIDTASSSDVCLEKYMKLSEKSLCKDVNKSKKVSAKSKTLSDKIIESSDVPSSKTVSDKIIESSDVPSSKTVSEKIIENSDVASSNTLSDKIIEGSDDMPPKALYDLIIEDPDVASENTDNTFEQIDVNISTHLYPKAAKTSEDKDNSYFNVLTPPKSVPELDQLFEPNFSEVQRPFSFIPLFDSSVLPSMQSEYLDVPNSDFINPNGHPFLLSEPEQSIPNIEICSNSISSECNVSKLSVNASSKTEDLLSEKNKQLNEKSEAQKSPVSSEDADGIFCKTVRNGWTVDDAGYLTVGELFLLLGKPSKILLEYEFEYPESVTASNETTAEASSSGLSNLLSKVVEVAQSYVADPKQKQLPSKQHARSNASKSSKVKLSGLSDIKSLKDIPSSLIRITDPDLILRCKAAMNKKDGIIPDSVTSSTVCASSTSPNTMTFVSGAVEPSTSASSSSSSPSDKHVFIMPVGAPLRNAKHPNPNALKEELAKLLPCTRRGCRVRRKPLVVQRPLLPREGMKAMTGARPMTVVHLVPSVSPITTVIPPCSRPKSSIPAPVKILPSGTPVDIHPVQVPVIKQLQSNSGQSIILQNPITSSHVIVNPSTTDSLNLLNTSLTGVSSIVQSSLSTVTAPSENIASVSQVDLNASTDLNTLNLDLLSSNTASLNESKDSFSSLSQFSLSDTTNLVSSPSCSFLDEYPLAPKSSIYDTSSLSSCLNLDLTPTKDFPSSENQVQPFKINSDIQWLGGESTELSLNTFLSSIESPTKMSSTSTASISAENSNLDPIARLAPVVDSQVRCLLDECSIDFITKFEDLADVINNSSSSDSKNT